MTDVDLEVVDSFERLFPVPVVSQEWDDVLDRAGHRAGRRPSRRRRRGLVVAIAVAMLVGGLLVTPALGIGTRLLDFIQGAPAPPEVQTYFATKYLETHVDEAGNVLGERFAPVIASESRGILALETPDGPVYLWAAPTTDGRQCELIQYGDQLPNGQLALPSGQQDGSNGIGACEGHREPSVLMPLSLRTPQRPSVSIVRVRVYDPSITQVDIVLEDAPAVSLPVVPAFVPGSFGVAMGAVPREERTLAVVGQTADGAEVAREAFDHPATTSP